MKRRLLILLFLSIMMPPCHEPGTSMAQQCSEDQVAKLILPVVGGSTPAAGGTETIGNETEGGTYTNANDSTMYCYKLLEKPANSGTVDSITFTTKSGGGVGNTHVRLSIYNDDGNATPALSEPSTVVTNSATPEQNVTAKVDLTYNYVTKPSVVAGTQYWICISGFYDADGYGYYRTDVGGQTCAYNTVTYGTFPDWAGGGTLVTSRFYGKAYFIYSW
jgi:hypothetical protein